MTREVTFGMLEDTLESLGFRRVAGVKGKRVFNRAQGEGILVLPDRQRHEIVSPAHLAAVKHSLAELGIIDPVEFLAKVQKVR